VFVLVGAREETARIDGSKQLIILRTISLSIVSSTSAPFFPSNSAMTYAAALSSPGSLERKTSRSCGQILEKYTRGLIDFGTEDISLDALDSASTDNCGDAVLAVLPGGALERKSSSIFRIPLGRDTGSCERNSATGTRNHGGAVGCSNPRSNGNNSAVLILAPSNRRQWLLFQLGYMFH
jgi:hypothetical protein